MKIEEKIDDAALPFLRKFMRDLESPKEVRRLGSGWLSGFLAILLAIAGLLLGIAAAIITPKEEDPQIEVTMANVLVPYPGASVRSVLHEQVIVAADSRPGDIRVNANAQHIHRNQLGTRNGRHRKPKQQICEYPINQRLTPISGQTLANDGYCRTACHNLKVKKPARGLAFQLQSKNNMPQGVGKLNSGCCPSKL